MYSRLSALLCGFLAFLAFSFSAFAYQEEETALTRPNIISFELLGRGVLYSFNYDRSINEMFAVGAGISGYSASSDGETASLFLIPVYGNFYFSPGPSRGFLTGGLDIVAASATLAGDTVGASGAVPIIGGGWEYRGSGGFVFRLPGYILIGNGGTLFWIGLGFGVSF